MSDVWTYVASAYLFALAVLVGLTASVVFALMRWARAAREEEARK